LILKNRFEFGIAKILHSDEQVLWKATPTTKFIFSYLDIVMIPLAILLMCYTAALFTLIIGSVGFFAFLVAPCFIMGAYILYSRLGKKRRIKRRSLYLLTNQRLIGYDTRNDTVRDIELQDILLLYFTQNKNNIGTITFQRRSKTKLFLHEFYSNRVNTYLCAGRVFNALYEIENVKEVYDLLSGVVEK